VEKVFNSLAFLEQQLTEADIRTFVTLIRFDVAYYGLFKTNLAPIPDYPRVQDYNQSKQ